MSAFEELGVSPQIIQAIAEDDWLLPTAVQQEAIPLILTGGDVLVASETGSGKTGAFGLPCLQIVHEQLRGKCVTTDKSTTPASQAAPAGKSRLPLCLILEPTRELAEQTFKNMDKFKKYLEEPAVRILLLVGGQDDKPQLSALDSGVDICVGTLQKTMDLVRRNKLDISQIKFFVLDEADDLQKKDERGDLTRLSSQMKTGRADSVQTLLFSATLHTPDVKKLIQELTVSPTWVDLKGKDAVPDTVHHVILSVDPSVDLPWTDAQVAERAKFPEVQPASDGVHSKPTMSAIDKAHPQALRMSERVKAMKPKMLVKVADSYKMTQCLVFCRTNVDCTNLETYLNRLDGSQQHRGKFESGKENPYSCVVLAGARSQRERQSNLESFKDGDVRFLICTDVAARGLDIAGLPFVVQMTLPDDIENYIHRIGRCGRAERMGLAISLVSTSREKVWYHKCPSRGKNCTPTPGNTKLTLPFGPDGKAVPADERRLLVDEGGCTVWMDEPDLLKRIEQRCGASLPYMDIDDFSVEGVVESPLEEGQRKRKTANAELAAEPLSRRAMLKKRRVKTLVVYGARKSDAASAGSAKQAGTLAPMVDLLGSLETKVQQMFAKAMFGAASAAGPGAQATGAGVAAAVTQQGIMLVPVRTKAGVSEAPAAEKPKKKMRW